MNTSSWHDHRKWPWWCFWSSSWSQRTNANDTHRAQHRTLPIDFILFSFSSEPGQTGSSKEQHTMFFFSIMQDIRFCKTPTCPLLWICAWKMRPTWAEHQIPEILSDISQSQESKVLMPGKQAPEFCCPLSSWMLHQIHCWLSCAGHWSNLSQIMTCDHIDMFLKLLQELFELSLSPIGQSQEYTSRQKDGVHNSQYQLKTSTFEMFRFSIFYSSEIALFIHW